MTRKTRVGTSFKIESVDSETVTLIIMMRRNRRQIQTRKPEYRVMLRKHEALNWYLLRHGYPRVNIGHSYRNITVGWHHMDG